MRQDLETARGLNNFLQPLQSFRDVLPQKGYSPSTISHEIVRQRLHVRPTTIPFSLRDLDHDLQTAISNNRRRTFHGNRQVTQPAHQIALGYDFGPRREAAIPTVSREGYGLGSELERRRSRRT